LFFDKKTNSFMKKIRIIAASIAVILGITATATSNAATTTTYSVQTVGGSYQPFSGVPTGDHCDLSNNKACILEYQNGTLEQQILTGAYIVE